jgi:hypothetical protein
MIQQRIDLLLSHNKSTHRDITTNTKVIKGLINKVKSRGVVRGRERVRNNIRNPTPVEEKG